MSKIASQGGIQPSMPTAFCIVAAALGAAMHIGKLPPAVPVLERVLGVTLLQAGFLLSLVQFAGMCLGLMTGLAVQRMGLKRSMVGGLLVLGTASLLGSLAESATWLLVTRAFEGLGFLWVVLPGPGLLRMLVPRERINSMMGVWGTYMPLGTSLALLLGPWAMLLGSQDSGWRIWWCLLSGVAILMALLLFWQVPSDRSVRDHAEAAAPDKSVTRTLLALTLRSRPVWLMALTFAVYAGQWLAVVGFLPTIYAAAGVASTTAAWLTALAAALNMVGNVVAGRLLEKGISAPVLLSAGFLVMGTGTLLAFGAHIGPWWQYAAIMAFSAVGGLIPATLFSLSIRLAPRPDAVSATVGWLQQWSSAGQFVVPPLMAWVAVRAGGWQWTGAVSAALCIAGLCLALSIRTELERLRSPRFQ
ncbi:MAG: MFS transporter [Polaromonas sp.]|uniref:MFS transporter n=1 Tax=Polaromonas sp. TaxID=1869339 RepID=UPI0025EC5924|nr:MFS transporter [Polaromonas sp.]MBI2727370.1 MFS transporter [Polaromonas sp.]